MNEKFINWTVFVFLCFIWGSSFILMKVSHRGLTAPQIAALRIFSAAVAFIPFAVFHIRLVPRQKMGLLFFTGIFGNLLPAFCFAIAILKLDSSLAGILNSLTPICVVLVGTIVFRDRISSQKVIGVLVGFLGLCLLTITQKGINMANAGYSALVILATLSYGFNVNYVSHYLKGVRPLHIATVSIAYMSLPAGLILWQQGFFQVDFCLPQVQWAIFNCMVLGLVGSALATVLFYVLVQRASGLFASLVTYGIPFVALFWGFLDGESISVLALVCLAVILCGVWLANRPEKKPQSSAELNKAA